MLQCAHDRRPEFCSPLIGLTGWTALVVLQFSWLALVAGPLQTISDPPCRPTSETLTAMGKLIKQAGESAKVAVRTARQAAVKQAKALPGKDDQKRAEKQVMVSHIPLILSPMVVLALHLLDQGVPQCQIVTV